MLSTMTELRLFILTHINDWKRKTLVTHISHRSYLELSKYRLIYTDKGVINLTV
jgi:hypothetical protein